MSSTGLAASFGSIGVLIVNSKVDELTDLVRSQELLVTHVTAPGLHVD